jgi:hypothetical protein
MSEATAGVRVWVGNESIEIQGGVVEDWSNASIALSIAMGEMTKVVCNAGEVLLCVEPDRVAASVLGSCAGAGFAATDYPRSHAMWVDLASDASRWVEQKGDTIRSEFAPRMVRMLRDMADTLERENEGRTRPDGNA